LLTSVFLVAEIYVLLVAETIVLLVTKNSALLFTDYINTADAFDITDVVGVLGAQVSRMLGLDLSKGFSALLFPLHRHQLSFSKDKAFLSYTGL